MQFYFDESGDFGFPEDRFDAYVQAGVVCPDSVVPQLDAFLESRQEKWGVSELHAAELSPGRRLRICRFIAECPVVLVSQTIDTEGADRSAILRYRLAQAATLSKNLKMYRRSGATMPGYEEAVDRYTKRTGLASQISDGEFIQATLAIDLLFDAMQRAIGAFLEDEWREDFNRLDFIVDAKLPGKVAAGEKMLRDLIGPAIGSNRRFALDVPNTWHSCDPPHPFIEKFGTESGWFAAQQKHIDQPGIAAGPIFRDGLRFEDSRSLAGLQLADTAACVTRAAILHPDDQMAQLAFSLIRPKLVYRGTALRLAVLNTLDRASPGPRYDHLRS